MFWPHTKTLIIPDEYKPSLLFASISNNLKQRDVLKWLSPLAIHSPCREKTLMIYHHLLSSKSQVELLIEKNKPEIGRKLSPARGRIFTNTYIYPYLYKNNYLYVKSKIRVILFLAIKSWHGVQLVAHTKRLRLPAISCRILVCF